MRYVFMYPGQGSQAIGMGKDLCQASEIARSRFEEAGQLLQRDIARICFEGPEEELKATQNTQPALFTVEAAITDLLRQRGIQPTYTMGHSLGEYSALYGAGVLSFADGLRLVARRGALMAEAGKEAPGAMAAIIGLGREAIDNVVRGISSGTVVCANENSPEQTVISGDMAAVTEACDKLKATGAKRAIMLPVSGAFHSPLMQRAADLFSAELDPVNFRTPACPVIANVTARAETVPGTLKSLLVKQLVSPVRWVESVRHVAGLGAASYCEAGPGSVLQGLARKISPEVTVLPCGKAEEVFSLAV